MPTTYKQAGPDDQLAFEELRDELEPSLTDAEVRVKLMFAYADPDAKELKPALSLNGYPVAGLAHINSLKDRAEGKADGTVTIDHDQWQEWDEDRRRAVLHHELHHFQVQVDKFNEPMRDDLGRPKLKMRKHDVNFGWFACIAEIHGPASIEVEQAATLADADGQLLWTWAPSGEEARTARKAARERAKFDPMVGATV